MLPYLFLNIVFTKTSNKYILKKALWPEAADFLGIYGVIKNNDTIHCILEITPYIQ